METRKLRALLEVSAFYSPNPEAVFQAVLDAITSVYGETMAMINLIEGQRIQFRAVANPHRLMRRGRSILLTDSYCQFSTGPVCPVLIQDAASHEHYQEHPAVRFGLTRYLGVPIVSPEGQARGTLCFLDGRSAEPLDRDDVEFLSLLAVRVSAELERERLIEARLAQQREAALRSAALAEQLRRTAEEKRRFTAAVIHDLRQPITTLRTLLYVARVEADAASREECLGLMGQSTGELEALVDELMEYAEIESGRLLWRLEQAAPAEVVAACMELLRAEADAKGVELSLECGRSVDAVSLDRSRLAHVARNLIANAVKFTALAPSGAKRVTVRIKEVDLHHWSLCVEDTGPGVPEGLRERIFEECYRAPLPPGTVDPGGRGLGLAIVRHLCEAVGARVQVDGEVGRGACFTVTFPRQPLLAPVGEEGEPSAASR